MPILNNLYSAGENEILTNRLSLSPHCCPSNRRCRPRADCLHATGHDATSQFISNISMIGRVSHESYVLTTEQIQTFHQEGCVTLPDVLSEEEVSEIELVFDQFLNREIHVPGKDFCDMSKPFGIPFEEWSIVNCMLPTRYHPPFQNNIFESITADIVKQLHPQIEMVKDYDQLLNKRPGKSDAVFAWHQDMGCE